MEMKHNDMKTQRFTLNFFSIAAALLIFIAVVTIPSATAMNAPYTFRVEERGDHTLEVSATLKPWPDPSAAMKRYQTANAQRTESLIKQDLTNPIYVQVTFAHPMDWREARALAQAVDLQVDNYLMVGTGDHGEKATTIYNRSFEDAPPPSIEIGPRGQKTTLWGVMVIQGRLPAMEASLGYLARNPNVHMVDATAVEIRHAIQRNPRWQGKEIVSISLPSPFWDIVWGDGP